MEDYNHFFHSVIELTAARHGTEKPKPVDFFSICEEVEPNCSFSWRDSAKQQIHARGLGLFVYDTDAPNRPMLTLTADGISLASTVRVARRVPTRWERIASVPRSDWIAISALIISLITAIFD